MEPLFVFLLFSTFLVVLFSGYPVAFVLGGVGVIFALLGAVIEPLGIAEAAEPRMIGFVANRIFDTISNYSLIPISMFILMGIMLEQSGVAERLLISMRRAFGPLPGGLAVSVVVIGTILAASTGIIGASVVLLATIALPTLVDAGYDRRTSLGLVGATGCLGILVPPSIMLIVLGDQIRVPVGDLFVAALIPGLLLALTFITFVIVLAMIRPGLMPALDAQSGQSRREVLIDLCKTLVAPLALILSVLGSIVAGIASPTEAAGVGAAGATLLAALSGKLDWAGVRSACLRAGHTTAFLFMLIFGAACFSVVLRGYGGDEEIERLLNALPLGEGGLVLFVLFIVFLLGFFLDWMEIVLIVIPLVLPVLTDLGFDALWIAILIAICLQTSFLTPPVGMALFYLKANAKDVPIADIYKGALPFVGLQITLLAAVYIWPKLALWLPAVVFN